MKALEKLNSAMTESINEKVIAEIFYEITTPKEHKDVLAFLIHRLNSEKTLFHRFINSKSDSVSIEASELEKIESDFEGFILEHQCRAFAGN